MVCENILGNIYRENIAETVIDYVHIEWHETNKRLHRMTSDAGTDVALKLGNDVLRHGLRQGDIVYRGEDDIIAVDILPCEAIVVNISKQHEDMIPKVCYEIGNRHAALFRGRDKWEFITPYNEPTKQMLAQLHGVSVMVLNMKLDFDRSISSTVHNHTH